MSITFKGEDFSSPINFVGMYSDTTPMVKTDQFGDILERLEQKGFASTNLVFGIGSFNYQYQTRDTFGFAMKATNVVIEGEEKAIFKDPKTDSGLKKSLKGRVVVVDHPTDGLRAYDERTLDQLEDAEIDGVNLLQTVWRDGEFVKEHTFDEVRENTGLVQ